MSAAEGTPAVPPSQGGHSAQWGLSSLLIGSLLLILFPFILALEGGLMVGAYYNEFLKSEHIDLACTGAYVLVGGFFALAGFALLGALVGLAYTSARKQPGGLPTGGLVVSLLALVMGVVLLLATNESATWARDFQKAQFGTKPPKTTPRL